MSSLPVVSGGKTGDASHIIIDYDKVRGRRGACHESRVSLENLLGRTLRPRKAGRPPKNNKGARNIGSVPYFPFPEAPKSRERVGQV